MNKSQIKTIKRIVIILFIVFIALFNFLYSIPAALISISKGQEGIYLYSLTISNMNVSCQRLPLNAVSTNKDLDIRFNSSGNTEADIDMMLSIYSSFKERFPDSNVGIYSFGPDSDPHGLDDLSCCDSTVSGRKGCFSIARSNICNKPFEIQEELIAKISQNYYIDSLMIGCFNNSANDTAIYLSDLDIPDNNLKELHCKIINGEPFDIKKFNSLTTLYLSGAVSGDDLSFINEADDLKELYIVDQGLYYNNEPPDLDVIDQSKIKVYLQNGWNEFNEIE